MATNAERQRAYRQRLREGAGERLNLTVSVSAKRRLERLARHHQRTQRAMLEQLLDEAEGRVTAALHGEQLTEYYDGPLPRNDTEAL